MATVGAVVGRLVACVAVCCAACVIAAGAQAARTTSDGIGTAAQVTRGEAVYRRACARCHLDDLVGVDRFPALVGDAFFDKWIGGTVATFVDRMRSMPADAPASLPDADYVDLAVFVLNANGVPTGQGPLAADEASHKNIVIQKR